MTNTPATDPGVVAHQIPYRIQRYLRTIRLFAAVGLFQVLTDIDADGNDQQADDERHAPAPGIQRLFRQKIGECQPARGAEQGADALADGLPADEKAALIGPGGLQQQRGGRADFTAGGEALNQTADHDQHRRQNADLRIGRCEGDQGGADAHQDDSHQHGGLAADPVGIGAQHHAAQRAHDKADAEHRHRHQQRAVGAVAGKIEFADDGGKEAVYGEVENLRPLPRLAPTMTL